MKVILEHGDVKPSRYCFIFLYACLPLLFGTAIYGLFRKIVWINAGVPLIQVKDVALGQSSLESWMTDFIIYTLPDAIWSFSLVIFVGALWMDKKSNLLFWNFFCLLLGTSFEVGQFLGLFNGYFSVNDLISSAVASLLAVQCVLSIPKETLVISNEK